MRFIVAVLLLSMAIVFPIASVRASTTYLQVVNPSPVDGPYDFILPPDTPVGTTFLANITITDVVNLAGWQVNLTYDPRLLKVSALADIKYPADHVFAGLDPYFAGKGFDNTIGYLTYACAIGPESPADHFDGSGTLCQIRFTTVKNGTGDPVFCELVFDVNPEHIITTSIRDADIEPIPFEVQEGSYFIPEFPTVIFPALFLIVTLLALALGKRIGQKNGGRPIAK